MPSPFSPKFKYNLSQIIPFGIIWLFMGWLFTLSESLLPQETRPGTDIEMTWPVALFATFALTTLGLIVGSLETFIFQKRFKGYSFTMKIIIKFFIYLFLLLLAIGITYPTATVIESGWGFFSFKTWSKTGDFFLSTQFLNALLQLSFSLFLSLLYSAISENLGHNVLLNFFTGKYHKPVIEKRVFMFLDMKSSTTIAEKLGHVQYFKLLGEYYDMMSAAIIDHCGEVYQYIGDEVVVTWKSELGLEKNNCLRCFFEIKKNLEQRKEHFLENYGVLPDFKAGIHIGETTTGEIGALKKEIVFVGDVLNTTARIQGMCNEYHTDLIISKKLWSGLEMKEELISQPLGDIQLKGKKGKVTLLTVTTG